MLAESYREVIKEIGEEDKALKELGLPPSSAPSLPFIPFLAERSMQRSVMDAVRMIMDRKPLADFHVSSTQVLLALKCYKNTVGDLPESLNELVPDYLNELPKDPFDGDVLRYSKDKKVVYSVGKDFIDSGGSDKDGVHPGEPTLRIGF